jgi:tripartite-type tricarboxylate transporter receptor subunit TctC
MNKMTIAIASVGAALLVTFSTFAQNYPSKTVRIIVPYPPGGTSDILSRLLSPKLNEAFGQPIVVDNRAGANGNIGADLVAKSAPDGYTLLVMSNTHTTNESLLSNKPYQLMRDFLPVATINYSDLLMVVHPSVPAKSVKEFIDLAKKDPGKLNYASSGPGTPYHMAGELFKSMSGTDIVHVPHKASGDARNSVLSGNVQMMFDAVTTMTALAKGGQVRALATTGLQRNPLTPDLPTVAETVPGYEATIWLGLMAPKGTPKEVITFLNTAINKVINLPAVKEVWLKQGAIPLVKTPAEFEAYLHKDIEKWAAVVKTSGAKVQ